MCKLARVSLTTADLEAAEAFYRDALGFERLAVQERAGEAFAQLMGVVGARARVAVLRLGRQEMELVAFAPRGAPYPPGSASNDLWFQHIAIVVVDMGAAYARLRAHPGWSAISTQGPQRLPESSGGVTAFKFRDHEGHPLELLEFPPGKAPTAWLGMRGNGPCLGIDHSAISVADTARSVAFYARLGLSVAASSLNQGAEQERLDDVPGAIVEVTALEPPGAPTPHIELLGYRRPVGRAAPAMHSNDVAKARLVLEAEDLPALVRTLIAAGASFVSPGVVTLAPGCPAALLRDPDGHDLLLQGF